MTLSLRTLFASLVLPMLLAACGGGGGGSSTPAPAPTPVVSLSASPTSVASGQVVTLSWSVSNPTGSTCDASGAWSGSLSTSGSQSVIPTAVGTTTYTITCSGVSKSVNVAVTAPVAAPTVSIALAPASVNTGQKSVLTWSSTNASACTASGAWSGSQATSGTLSVSQTTAGTYTYAITCTGGGGNASASATLGVSAGVNNVAAMVVDNGPASLSSGTLNTPYVSVTICRPGTSICQTIDHVLVDTGSIGLRVITPLDSSLALPAVKAPSGDNAGLCGQFVSGFTWGAVQQADVKIAGETAAGVSIEVINSPNVTLPSAPTDCAATGTNIGTISGLGANAVLGVGVFKEDCGNACANRAVSATYYACTSTSCTPSSMPLASQVTNPVASFDVDNNGVLLVLPSVPTGGSNTLTGSLIFGIGTQSNNQIVSETLYQTNSQGNFTTTYKGATNRSSFIDSGSNAIFFNDSSLTKCSFSTDFYCPASPVTLTAVNAGADGRASGTVNFTIESVDRLGASITAASVGGTNGSSTNTAFDWGLPFFFGRRLFVGIEGTASPSGIGPYWAY